MTVTSTGSFDDAAVALTLSDGDDKAVVSIDTTNIQAGVASCWDIGVDAGLGNDVVTVTSTGSFEDSTVALTLGDGDNRAVVTIDTTNIQAGIVPCMSIGIDAGAGNDRAATSEKATEQVKGRKNMSTRRDECPWYGRRGGFGIGCRNSYRKFVTA